MTTTRYGAVHAPYSRGKMMTAMPGGVRLVPVPAMPSRSRQATPSNRRTINVSNYTVSPKPLVARATPAGREHRRRVVAEIVRQERRAFTREPQHTRGGIAQDYFNADLQRREERTAAVTLHLRRLFPPPLARQRGT
jgi:hypothetical protein